MTCDWTNILRIFLASFVGALIGNAMWYWIDRTREKRRVLENARLHDLFEGRQLAFRKMHEDLSKMED